MSLILNETIKTIQECGRNKHYCIAYSGGVDSHVLLHVMASISQQIELAGLRAVHINHQLQETACEWEKHCAEICDQLSVPFHPTRIDIQLRRGDSLEAVARDGRYEKMASMLQRKEVLLTAHHQDDQAETLLLQLLRGAGVKGLAAMPQNKPIGEGSLFRPFLQFTRQQLLEYAHTHELRWVEDKSNSDIHFNRNYLRHKVMPLIQARWPQCGKTLSRSAQHCSSADNLISELAQLDLYKCRGESECILSVKAMLTLSLSRRNQVFRYWMSEQYKCIPNQGQLSQINNMLLARGDAQACVVVGKIEIRRHLDQIHIMEALVPYDANQVLIWRLDSDCILPGKAGSLSLQALKKAVPNSLSIDSLEVRFRRGGERIKLPGRTMTHSLKKMFNEWKVLPWLRDQVPLLYHKGRLVMVWGYTGFLE